MINDAPAMQSASANYSPVKIAVLAPRWLQEALSILLLSEDSLMLVTNVQTEDELFAQSLSQIPDIIVIDADFRLNKALEQITRIKTELQSATSMMLVDQANQDRPLTEAETDAVVRKAHLPRTSWKSSSRSRKNAGSKSREKASPEWLHLPAGVILS